MDQCTYNILEPVFHRNAGEEVVRPAVLCSAEQITWTNSLGSPLQSCSCGLCCFKDRCSSGLGPGAEHC